MTYKQAAEFVVGRRKHERDAAQILFGEALKSEPALLTVETELRALRLAEIKGEKIDQKHLVALEKEKSGMLAALGLTGDALDPPPHCAQCGDTARTGGGYCACVKALALNGQKSLEFPCRSFSEIDYERFDANHRERNRVIYESVQKICDKYPGNKRKVVTVLGGTGTGKTLLAGCAATRMAERGLTVCAVTAFGFVNRALKYHTTFDGEKLSFLEPLLDADFLAVDDLGTESILKNVTHEYLLNVLNERIHAGKLTIFTSNLSQAGIMARYGERIYSRLFDKALGYTEVLGGKDLRVN